MVSGLQCDLQRESTQKCLWNRHGNSINLNYNEQVYGLKWQPLDAMFFCVCVCVQSAGDLSDCGLCLVHLNLTKRCPGVCLAAMILWVHTHTLSPQIASFVSIASTWTLSIDSVILSKLSLDDKATVCVRQRVCVCVCVCVCVRMSTHGWHV